MNDHLVKKSVIVDEEADAKHLCCCLNLEKDNNVLKVKTHSGGQFDDGRVERVVYLRNINLTFRIRFNSIMFLSLDLKAVE
jgi:hypothetical protein